MGYRLLFLLAAFFFAFIPASYPQEEENTIRGNLEDSDINRHVETAIVGFFGILFVENHDLTNFSNSRGKNKRIFPTELISKSKNQRVQQVIRKAMDSVKASWVVSQRQSLISFSIPGGTIYYYCHTDTFLSKDDEDHCMACENPHGVSSVRLNKKRVVELLEVCPNPL